MPCCPGAALASPLYMNLAQLSASRPSFSAVKLLGTTASPRNWHWIIHFFVVEEHDADVSYRFVSATSEPTEQFAATVQGATEGLPLLEQVFEKPTSW